MQRNKSDLPLSLQLMNVTRDWVSSLRCFASPFTCSWLQCLFVCGPSAFSFVFSEWMHAQSGWNQEIDFAEYYISVPSKTPGLLLLYVLDHRHQFVLWSTVQFNRLAESGQRVYPYTLQNESGCFCLLSHHHETPVTQCYWKPCTLTPSLLYQVSQMMLYALDHELFQAFSILFLPVILVQVELKFQLSKECFSKVVFNIFFRCFFLAKSNLSLFAPCDEPSLFALVKSSLNCRLWQWHVYLLESVLHLARCCEGFSLPWILRFPPWTSRPFYVA